MGQRFLAEIASFKVNRKYLKDETHKNKRIIVPLVGKILSFFGTLDEANFSYIRANIRQLQINQQRVTQVLTNSMIFIKDNQHY